MNEMLLVGKQVLQRLIEAGHQAYFVGGCVRDMIMNQPIKDIDIATSALPEEVENLFARTIPTGKKFGTITVVRNYIHFEVTTFRKDIEYRDSRHPEVSFSKTIEEDLERRDFTVNAIAMDNDMNIVDPYNGRKDIEDKILRTVGDPIRRFTEDPLRLMRLARFYGRFDGFTIEEETMNAVRDKSQEMIRKVAIERIRRELDQIFEYSVSKRRKSLEVVQIILKDTNILFNSIHCIAECNKKTSSMINYLILYYESRAIDNVLRLSNYEFDLIKEAQILLCKKIDNYDIFHSSREALALVEEFRMLYLNELTGNLVEKKRRLSIQSIKDLALTSKQIINLIGKENIKKISKVQDRLIHEILEGRVENTERSLSKFIKSLDKL